MPNQDIKTLHARIDSLIEMAEHLVSENNRLRSQEASLISERNDLQRKNELAKARVEAIILRLKALESQE